MKVICVDDERLLMEDTVAMCSELPEISEATGFTSANAARGRRYGGHGIDPKR